MRAGRYEGQLAPAGDVAHQIIRADGRRERPSPSLSGVPLIASFADVVRYAFPRKGLLQEINDWRARNFGRVARQYARVKMARRLGVPTFNAQLSLAVIRSDGRVIPYGLASFRVVTTAGVNAIVDAFQNTVEVETFNYHGIGTGTTAEAVGDTALVTELSTEYNPDNTRATGSQGENGANVYQSVATNSVDSAVAITEHGLFTQAATGGGTLLDRSVFSVINLGNGDSLQSTYEITFTAGS